MSKKNGKPRPKSGDDDWVTVWEVRHWRSKKMIRRKDGKPFRFPRRKK